jgi:chemotaxis protein MotB
MKRLPRSFPPDEAPDDEGAPGWMVTFGDTVSLMLTFFVLIFSFSTLEPRRFVAVAGEVKDAFGVDPDRKPLDSNALPAPADASDDGSQTTTSDPRRKLLGALDVLRRTEIAGAQSLRVFETFRGTEVLLPAEDLFEAGREKPASTALPLLDLVAGVIRGLPADQRVVVEVPADPSESTPPGVDGEWGLATQRGLHLVRHLREKSSVAARRIQIAATGVRPGHRVVTFLVEKTLEGREATP